MDWIKLKCGLICGYLVHKFVSICVCITEIQALQRISSISHKIPHHYKEHRNRIMRLFVSSSRLVEKTHFCKHRKYHPIFPTLRILVEIFSIHCGCTHIFFSDPVVKITSSNVHIHSKRMIMHILS